MAMALIYWQSGSKQLRRALAVTSTNAFPSPSLHYTSFTRFAADFSFFNFNFDPHRKRN